MLRALALILAIPAPAAAHAVQETQAMQPDFSTIRTKAAAKRLAAAGKLVKIHLFPRELGGQDDPENIVYITPAAAKERDKVIALIAARMAKGELDRMDVLPDYRGDSIIPVRLVFNASHSGNRNRTKRTVDIW